MSLLREYPFIHDGKRLTCCLHGSGKATRAPGFDLALVKDAMWQVHVGGVAAYLRACAPSESEAGVKEQAVAWYAHEGRRRLANR